MIKLKPTEELSGEESSEIHTQDVANIMLKKDEIKSDSSYDVNKSYASVASGAIASARSDSAEEDLKDKQRVKWNDANKEFLSHIKPILERT